MEDTGAIEVNQRLSKHTICVSRNIKRAELVEQFITLPDQIKNSFAYMNRKNRQ